MKKILGSLLLAVAALAMPVAATGLTGCSGGNKAEKIEGVEEKHEEGHDMQMQEQDDTEKPPEGS